MTGQQEKERLVREVISWLSVWTRNLCVSGLTLYPLRYLRYLMIQQPSAELLLHSPSPVWLTVRRTVMRGHYLLCSRLCTHLHYGILMRSRVELTNIISVFKLRVWGLPLGLLARWLAALLWSKHPQRNWPSFLSSEAQSIRSNSAAQNRDSTYTHI